jgi:flagellar hook-associated protein 3 FlgL
MCEVLARNLSANMEKLVKNQTNVSSGKRILKPSDDPLGAAKASNYKHVLSTIGQYERNIQDGTARLQTTESALENLGQLLVRLKEIAVYQSSETANAQTRAAVAEEVKAIRLEIVRLANTQYKGSYIFSGYQIHTAPYDETGTYFGDSERITSNVGDGVEVTVGLTGEEVFQGAGLSDGVDIFTVAENLRQALESNDTVAIQAAIEPLGMAASQVLGFRAEIGAGLNRMETIGRIYSDLKLNTEELLSGVEDLDIADAMTRLAAQEAVYKASLAAAGRIITQSILDYL